MGQNAPQQVPFGLYAEQLSGTAFTAPRALNRRTWAYRIRPSVMQLDALDQGEHKRGSERSAKPCPPATEQRGDTARRCDREHDRDER